MNLHLTRVITYQFAENLIVHFAGIVHFKEELLYGRYDTELSEDRGFPEIGSAEFDLF